VAGTTLKKMPPACCSHKSLSSMALMVAATDPVSKHNIGTSTVNFISMRCNVIQLSSSIGYLGKMRSDSKETYMYVVSFQTTADFERGQSVLPLIVQQSFTVPRLHNVVV
jgi:hypothetical protein